MIDINEWLRYKLGPNQEMLDLLAQKEREVLELTDLLRRADQRTDDLRKHNAQLRRDVIEAHEPVQMGNCTKLRWQSEDYAWDHSVRLAQKFPMEPFQPYICQQCPPYPGLGTRPWHAGHSRLNADGWVMSDKGVLHYSCGCKFGTSSQIYVWRCADHPAEAQEQVG